MYRWIRKAAAVSMLGAVLMTGCGKNAEPVRVMDNDMMIQIVCQNADVTMKTLEDGFEFDTIEGKVRGDLLTGVEADSIISSKFNTESYAMISVGNNNGFSFIEEIDEVKHYVHVVRLSENGIYVRLDSTNGENALRAVESTAVFSNVADTEASETEN